MTALEALSRTMLLMRTDLATETLDDVLLNALLTTNVALVADASNLRNPEAQQALVTAAALIARSGAQVYVEAPEVLLHGIATPLQGRGLVEALVDLGADLVPGCRIIPMAPPNGVDLAVVIGDSKWKGKADQVVFLSGDAWTGRIGPNGERWRENASPFGALAAAGLAAAEGYKAAVRKARAWARNPALFDSLFAPAILAEVATAPSGSPPPSPRLGSFDIVSGGAIAQAALYALAGIPTVDGQARVIEPEKSDLTNINRYAFLRRSRVGEFKSDHLASLDLGGLKIASMCARYDDRQAGAIGPLARNVLVGVDHVPSRWLVQRARPHWLGIGATSDYSVVVTFHCRGLPCARCLHPDGAKVPDKIPTAAFVSHWAGLWLASAFARAVSGEGLDPHRQQLYMATLRADSPDSIWQTAGAATKGCELRCPL